MFKMNVFRRMLILMISTALLSFLSFGLVSYLNMKEIYKATIKNGKKSSDSVAEFTKDLTINQTKNHLRALALEKSRRMDRGLSEVKYDAESIAFQITEILTHPEKYKEINLPNHQDKPIFSGEAYVHYAPIVARNGISDELKHEVAISSNIADMLKVISSFYKGHQTSSYIGSKNGYLICIDTLTDQNGQVNFTEEFNTNYDPRERPWYKEAEEAKETKITNFYTAADGYLAVTFATPYYDKEGFAGVAAVGASLESLYKQITENSIGNSNINFALNDKGEVVLSSEKNGPFAVSKEHRDLRKSKESSLAKEAINMSSGKSDVALVKVEDKEYYLAYAPMSSIGWSFGTLIEIEEIIKPAKTVKENVIAQSHDFTASMQNFYKKHTHYILYSLILIMILLFAISYLSSKKAVKPILTVIEGVKEIAKGNLEKKLDINSGDEIEVLANSVNNMTTDLKNYMENLSKVTADKERIATELNVARNIQTGMLPSVSPDFSNRKEFDLAAVMIPAKEVAGDFYDFYMLDDNHLALTVADVSGKGVGAALFMMTSKTVLKNCAMMASATYSVGKEPDLAHIMEKANLQLSENNKEFMFVTVFLGILDLKTGKFSYVNAGHNPPFVHHVNENGFTYIRNTKKNCIMGIKKKINYHEDNITLTPGDKLFFYTDGITEAMNEQKELFSESRLKSVLDSLENDNTSKDILFKVYEDVKKHAGDAEQSDDMTMLGLIYKGEK